MNDFLLMTGLVKHYGSANHHDYRECMTAKAKLSQAVKGMGPALAASVSYRYLFFLAFHFPFFCL